MQHVCNGSQKSNVIWSSPSLQWPLLHAINLQNQVDPWCGIGIIECHSTCTIMVHSGPDPNNFFLPYTPEQPAHYTFPHPLVLRTTKLTSDHEAASSGQRLNITCAKITSDHTCVRDVYGTGRLIGDSASLICVVTVQHIKPKRGETHSATLRALQPGLRRIQEASLSTQQRCSCHQWLTFIFPNPLSGRFAAGCISGYLS